MNAPLTPSSSVDPAEIAKFEAMAAEWWDPTGKFRPLHMLQPCRLDYVTRQIAADFDRDLTAERPFSGLSLIDIGCGGGLLCEPMTRLGAVVTGIDAAARNIPVAAAHARQSGLAIDYRHTTAEAVYPFDARGVAKRFRHAAIFGALDSLTPGETMRFVNDHDPIPLLHQLQTRYGAAMDISYVQREPGQIVIDFARV